MDSYVQLHNILGVITIGFNRESQRIGACDIRMLSKTQHRELAQNLQTSILETTKQFIAWYKELIDAKPSPLKITNTEFLYTVPKIGVKYAEVLKVNQRVYTSDEAAVFFKELFAPFIIKH